MNGMKVPQALNREGFNFITETKASEKYANSWAAQLLNFYRTISNM